MADADSATIRTAVIAKYQAVAVRASGHFPYPVGRASALGLGYGDAWLDPIPGAVLERFVGVGNPFSIRRPTPGQRVLDAGCGCGTDSYVASSLVGPEGEVVGLDMTPEMLDVAREGLTSWPLGNLSFREGDIQRLPFADGAFDLVISNGVLNLTPDKGAAFRELRRVLRTGGALVAADLLVEESIPEEVLQNMDAWST